MDGTVFIFFFNDRVGPRSRKQFRGISEETAGVAARQLNTTVDGFQGMTADMSAWKLFC